MTICDLWMEQVKSSAGSPNSGMLATKGNLACIFVLERWSNSYHKTVAYTTVDAPPLR